MKKLDTPLNGLREIVREQTLLLRNEKNPDHDRARDIFAGAKTEFGLLNAEMRFDRLYNPKSLLRKANKADGKA